jgi:multidrug efflux pump subunit AcrB
MNLPYFALRHRSIILAFIVVFLVVGTFNFTTMPRREDPELTIRDALIVTAWPSASATRVEELITDPIEDVIVEIAEVETVKSKSMVGLSIVQVSASDYITETDQVWDDVRAKVESIRSELPIGTTPPFVNSDFGDVYEIVFALHQTELGGVGEYSNHPENSKCWRNGLRRKLNSSILSPGLKSGATSPNVFTWKSTVPTGPDLVSQRAS